MSLKKQKNKGTILADQASNQEADLQVLIRQYVTALHIQKNTTIKTNLLKKEINTHVNKFLS